MASLGGARAGEIFNTYIIDADGYDIWGTSDVYGYLYQSKDNATLESIVQFPPTNSLADNAKIGIMYRETLDNNTRFHCIVKRKDGIILSMTRATVGGPVNIFASYNFGQNIDKFKLEKLKDVSKVSYYNGSDWVLLDIQNMQFATGGTIGFCFAMIGGEATCFINNPILTVPTVVGTSKPTNLNPQLVQIACATTSQSGGQTNTKPVNLVPQVVQISCGGTVADTLPPAPSTGFQVFSFHWKAGMSYIQGGGRSDTMKITVNTRAGTITDEYYSWKPNTTCYVKWKIDSGPWHGTYPGGDSINLINYVLPTTLRDKPITITKYFFEPGDFYHPIKYPLQQMIRFN